MVSFVLTFTVDEYGNINFVYEMQKEDLFNSFNKLASDWNENHQDLLKIIRYFESKKIPLRRLSPFLKEFLSISKVMREKWDSFYLDKYQMQILPAIKNHEKIDDTIIESMLIEWPLIQEISFTIGAYYIDLEIAIQNIFIGGLYSKKYKVDYRKPLDPKYKVIKPLDR